ncbi:MAG: biosynthetic arginine decarboxylase [bacterium]
MPENGAWSVQDSIDAYHITEWGAGYFRVSPGGTVEVTPHGPDGPHLDLEHLVEQLRGRGLGLPLLLRFPDIIASRIRSLTGAFDRAITEESYRGKYHCVYPIKVNQHRRVVEAVLEHGASLGLGLEAGSKPEVLAALALADRPTSLLILNGYKDAEFVETALLARKLGRDAIIVIDRYRELDTVLRVAEELGIPPRIGVRARLDAQIQGKWTKSSGLGSKFGLHPEELVAVVRRLEEHGLLDSLVLLHFHVGSQITGIAGLKDAVQEGARIYVELAKLGVPLKYLDVGGGLGVDYDGSQSTNDSSMNYDLQEYANNVVFHIREMCDEKDVPHPDIISESGRAIVAHHSVLVLDLPDMDPGLPRTVPESIEEEEHRVLHALYETWKRVDADTFLECWHDANHLREEAVTLFSLGVLDLAGRARADQLYRACCSRVLDFLRSVDPEEVPEELAEMERRFCDIYFGNFSVFQSAPDHWAVDQLFPIMPIHRLLEQPTRRAIIADLTCDSDGVIDRFIGNPERSVLPLHRLNGKAYYLGIFLLGAYQEILGDLHNLFGDTNAVHISVDAEGKPVFLDVFEHDTVTDVLQYVGYDRKDLLARMRRAVEVALQHGRIGLEESALFLRDYERGLSGTTYLEEEPPADEEERVPERPAAPARVSEPAR